MSRGSRTIGAVVLAAGEAARFGSPKQHLLLGEVLRALRRAPSVGAIVVVEGAYPFDQGDAASPGVRFERCADWERGPGASLRCGLAALPSDAEAAVIVLADGPDLDPASVERVVGAWAAGADDLVAASYGGVRGHPVVLGRTAFGQIPNAGLRVRQPVLVPCDDLRIPGDVDTPDELPTRLRT